MLALQPGAPCFAATTGATSGGEQCLNQQRPGFNEPDATGKHAAGYRKKKFTKLQIPTLVITGDSDETIL
jgi:hypothetical protein